MKIQLDASALAALFPPGSEAEVELRRVVVAALVQRIAIKDVKELQEKVKNDAAHFIKQEIARFAPTDFGRIALSDAVKGAILKEVSNLIDVEIHQAARSFWDDKAGKLSASIDKAVSYHTEQNIKELAKKAVREVLAEGIK